MMLVFDMFRPLQKAAMTLLGRLKYFRVPPVIVFDPSTYRVKGGEVRELLGVLQLVTWIAGLSAAAGR